MWRRIKAFFRTLAVRKALSWRVIAIAVTFVTAFLVTGSFKIAGSIGALDAVFKTVLYWVHEKFWEKVNDRDSRGTDRGVEEIRSKSETEDGTGR